MLSESASSFFLGEAHASYVHVSNCIPTTSIAKATTPYELWHGRKPDVSSFTLWGCLPMCMCRRTRGWDWVAYAEVRVYWVSFWLQGLEIYDLASRRTLISERADFDERHFLSSQGFPPIPIPSFLTQIRIWSVRQLQGGRILCSARRAPLAPVAAPPVVPLVQLHLLHLFVPIPPPALLLLSLRLPPLPLFPRSPPPDAGPLFVAVVETGVPWRVVECAA